MKPSYDLLHAVAYDGRLSGLARRRLTARSNAALERSLRFRTAQPNVECLLCKNATGGSRR